MSEMGDFFLCPKCGHVWELSLKARCLFCGTYFTRTGLRGLFACKPEEVDHWRNPHYFTADYLGDNDPRVLKRPGVYQLVRDGFLCRRWWHWWIPDETRKRKYLR